MMTRYVFAGTALLVLAAAAWADDIQPPPWRGEWSTTSQVWEFILPDPAPLPDGPAPGGMPPLPSTHLVVQPLGDWIPVDPASGREGIWPLSGIIEVTVDNHEPPNEFKWVWMQLTWTPGIAGGLPPEPILENFNPMWAELYPPTIVMEEQLPCGWFETTYEWRIYPNPPDEFFTISGDIWVDQLVIDTWCIPEPATLALLGFGGVGLLLRRRR